MKQYIKFHKDKKIISDNMAKLKTEILDYTDLEELDETTFSCEGDYIEVVQKVKHELVDIIADVEIKGNILPNDEPLEILETTFKLSKEGRKRFKKGDEDIAKLMIPVSKKTLQVVLAGSNN